MPRMNLGLPYQNCSVQSCIEAFQNPNLLRCGGCHVVKYCGQPHQKADRPRHKVQCGPISKQKKKLDEEEAKLRANPGEDAGGLNPFDHHVGRFWLLRSTRPYLQARFDYITAILNVRTGEAVEVALNHSLDLLRLHRGDNLGEAYDFIKWYAVKADYKYDWSDMSLPFLDLHNQNAVEAVDEKPNHSDTCYFVALTLIKIRLMKDLEGLQKFVQSKPHATGEERYDYLQEEAMSDILLNRPDVVAVDNYQELIDELQHQALQLYKIVKERNSHFWPGIMNPMLYAYDVPTVYISGSREEAVLIFRNSWYSWSETEPAIQVIRDTIKNDK
ncbi:hypothetical protein ACHAPU_000889 [Fusarium lateritium]